MLIIPTVDIPMLNIPTCPSLRPPTLRIPSLRSPSLCLPSVRSSSLRSLVMVGGLTCVPFCMGRCGSLACRLRQPLNTCMQFSKGPLRKVESGGAALTCCVRQAEWKWTKRLHTSSYDLDNSRKPINGWLPCQHHGTGLAFAPAAYPIFWRTVDSQTPPPGSDLRSLTRNNWAYHPEPLSPEIVLVCSCTTPSIRVGNSRV